MEKIMNFVKGLFVKEDGGINWKTIIGIGAGVALGGLTGIFGAAEGFNLTGALIGGGLGLGGAALLDAVMPSAAAEPTPDAAPGRPPMSGGRGQAPDIEVPAGPSRPQPRGR